MSDTKGPPQGRNCVACKARKVRCDRGVPCSSCHKAKRECVYPTTGRLLRKADAAHSRRRLERTELLGRIRHLEQAVQQLDSIVASTPAGRHSPVVSLSVETSITTATASASASAKPATHHEQGVLVNSKTYVGDNFWATLHCEVRGIRERLEVLAADDETEAEAEVEDRECAWIASGPSAAQAQLQPPSSFIFCNPRRGFSCEGLRPLPSQTLFIWDTFVERHDPFIKVLHGPTMRQAIRAVDGSFARMDADMEALMFCVSLAVASALAEEEVRSAFGSSKEELMRRFQLGAEETLARANFTSTTSLTVLAAFIVYTQVRMPFTVVRQTWALVGLVVRLAVTLGLHRDASAFASISPFEAEMRRRIWWHVCFLDFYAGDRQEAALSMHVGLFDTAAPRNLNDADLRPDMVELPPARQGYTDTSLCLIQREAWLAMKGVKDMVRPADAAEAEALWARLKQQLTERIHGYLRDVDHTVDVVLPTVIKCVVIITDRYELLLRSLRRSTPSPPSSPPPSSSASSSAFPSSQAPMPGFHDEASFRAALNVINAASTFKALPAMQRWRWKVDAMVDWHAMAVILSRICTPDWDEVAEDAFGAITVYLRHLPAIVREEAMWPWICKVIQRIQRHRAHHMQAKSEEQPPSAPDPDLAVPVCCMADASAVPPPPPPDPPSCPLSTPQDLGMPDVDYLRDPVFSTEEAVSAAGLVQGLPVFPWGEWVNVFSSPPL